MMRHEHLLTFLQDKLSVFRNTLGVLFVKLSIEATWLSCEKNRIFGSIWHKSAIETLARTGKVGKSTKKLFHCFYFA